ncbi:PLP-dependent aminotransferase family protein [Cohnella caldifontis]|uniref:MocR-like pyridoxine biosynthesis transcription factor PdxR n=1 Tax=Cohnella caldifontis TaxID=3027471 RepID=UPI0023EDFECC|nr:PLP-dependent aminotransferase family protein [Cohnella sp. YIM B05605]
MYGIYLDPRSERSITAQLCSQLRGKIESGELAEGTRLPATRRLAAEYGIARNVALDAYEQLIAEGYLIGQTGSGTYVAGGILANGCVSEDESEPGDGSPSAEFPYDDGIIDFSTGTPDLRHFPRIRWARYLKEAAEAAPIERYDYGDIRGEDELRQEIASYLLRARGMRCHPDRIFVVSGSADGLALAARALRTDYRSVYLEDPTIELSRHVFEQADYRLLPVEVDESGMKLHELDRLQDGSLMLLTPSHQFPSGSILSIQRRRRAIWLAEQAGSYLIEDDYDGDFRLKGVPIPPLHTLNPDRVIYVGTFSKTLAPALRLGFLVVPRRLAGRFAALREQWNHRAPSVPQIALARMIRDGRLERHIHKMKSVYRNRRTLLVGALHRHFGAGAAIRGDEAGMHVQAEFVEAPRAVDWAKAVEYGVRVGCVEEYSMVKGRHVRHVLLGYGNVPDEDVEEGILRLRRFVSDQAIRPEGRNSNVDR